MSRTRRGGGRRSRDEAAAEIDERALGAGVGYEHRAMHGNAAHLLLPYQRPHPARGAAIIADQPSLRQHLGAAAEEPRMTIEEPLHRLHLAVAHGSFRRIRRHRRGKEAAGPTGMAGDPGPRIHLDAQVGHRCHEFGALPFGIDISPLASHRNRCGEEHGCDEDDDVAGKSE
jgi:hypothetical protein